MPDAQLPQHAGNTDDEKATVRRLIANQRERDLLARMLDIEEGAE